MSKTFYLVAAFLASHLIASPLLFAFNPSQASKKGVLQKGSFNCKAEPYGINNTQVSALHVAENILKSECNIKMPFSTVLNPADLTVFVCCTHN